MKVPADNFELDFCESVVSELRQPLTTINGGVLLAKRLLETDPARAGEALDKVANQVGRLNLLLIELRDRAHDAAHAGALFE